ncbi:Gfo/Idh/MocA family protein [Stratiformator vulcanicus]|uniref:Inositol 2-dehydrogenase n=1 Tax=Stratiformator vulcanicus TaxID=2527980 RepID=A0A517R530_9PLAN|nr:Gfo/Idh/MocA family oxidoreductase [Stratiformator vulcanicus]QDT38997.1 Inositol 2-dehydrogenase [Stratiformator vulcanicus]
MNRRHFLGHSAAAATSISLLQAGAYAGEPSEPKKVGLIGCGWYGKNDLFRLLEVEDVNVIALCDVDSQMLAEAGDMTAERQKSGAVPQLYGDYRKMLAEHQFDIVLIGTPDHWHALNMIAAVEAGADVYCQKPISVDIVEGQAMVDAARRTNRVVQVGTQRRSTPHLVEARDKVIQPGLLGKIGYAEICCYYHMGMKKNPAPTPPPESLDYEMWTGPAPMKPYIPGTHPGQWRSFQQYGNGIVGDMCIHMLDMVRWMCDLGWPTQVSSTGGILVRTDSAANIPDTQTATFEFNEFPVTWTHRTWGRAPDPEYPWAAFLYGDKGTLKVSVTKWEFIPWGKGPTLSGEPAPWDPSRNSLQKNESRLEKHVIRANQEHQRDFLRAIEDRSRPVADIEQGHISTASCVLANMSLELGRSLRWDAVAGQVIGDDEANRKLARPYRSPWKHPTLSETTS